MIILIIRNAHLIILITLFTISCGKEVDNQATKALDSLKKALETSNHFDTSNIKTSKEELSNLISAFETRYNISPDWNKLSRSNSRELEKKLTGKYIIVPFTKNQAKVISNYGFTDSSLVFIGKNNNSFVFEITGEKSIIEKNGFDENGLLLLKIKRIKESSKLYLIRQGKDFRHTEKPVTEFILTCELINAKTVNINGDILLSEFEILEF